MIIRKLFKFENAHIVRGCTTQRCSQNVHGHSYKIEVLLESNYLDDGQMVYDFGLMKESIKDLIESFDHAITLWSADSIGYVEDMKKHSARWIELPVSPSAEQFSRIIYLMIERVLLCTGMVNGEREVKLHSIIVHETETGYAQGFKEDAYNKFMGSISLEDIKFSEQVKSEWKNAKLWDSLLKNQLMVNPKKV
ncbi:MAG: 6-carboxytetrahydropterin synthase (EC @ Queuosine biosynthesis QueD, PTPS-I [uncultured Sulfurovum sp.]|uniref:6-carboxy-5,6,7,8-tetrahydropterin synthase n=1 Tax=uncultured Sulfurovum sp. TaxID=269237 RepID=A0A6S6S9R2_9BACT|nr:MAG: 6-carboxytetrahydropterin synthase (EC @ Queuosine biosynthesis QueD, PTPS-I [uncultured Sulfurovum sp.]